MNARSSRPRPCSTMISGQCSVQPLRQVLIWKFAPRESSSSSVQPFSGQCSVQPLRQVLHPNSCELPRSSCIFCAASPASVASELVRIITLVCWDSTSSPREIQIRMRPLTHTHTHKRSCTTTAKHTHVQARAHTHCAHHGCWLLVAGCWLLVA